MDVYLVHINTINILNTTKLIDLQFPRYNI